MQALDLGARSKVYPGVVAQKISALADSLGISSDTLRYYERVGLLHPTDRTTSGYRIYDEAAEERLRFIKGAQRIGLQLTDIKELLDILDRGQCPCGHTRELVHRRLEQVEAEIARLAEVRKQLLDLGKRSLECVEGSEEWSCSVIEGR
jgi:DNA-binding transcriptional MerR regulator